MERMLIGRRAAKHCCCLFALMFVVFICPVRTFGFINSQNTVTVPPYPHIKDNAYPIFLQAARMTEKMKHLNPSSDPNINETLPIPLRNYALAYKDSIPALKVMKSALNKPCLCPNERAYNLDFEQFASLRNLARVTMDDAVYQYRIGHYFQSAQLHLDGMEMGVMIAHGGGLIPNLVSMVIEAICRKDLEKDIPHLTTSQLEYAEKRFQAIERKRIPFSDIVKEEGNSVVTNFIPMLGGTTYKQDDLEQFEQLAPKGMDHKSGSSLFHVGNIICNA